MLRIPYILQFGISMFSNLPIGWSMTMSQNEFGSDRPGQLLLLSLSVFAINVICGVYCIMQENGQSVMLFFYPILIISVSEVFSLANVAKALEIRSHSDVNNLFVWTLCLWPTIMLVVSVR